MKFQLSVTICALALLHTFHIHAQAAGNYLYNNPHSFNDEKVSVPVNSHGGNNVSLKSEVMMNVRATSYTAIFAATQSGTDIAFVDSMMNFRIQMIVLGLARIGIPETDIHIDAVSMVPSYSHKIEEKKFSKRAMEIPVGFEMKKNIHVLFKHHFQLDQIISQMAYAEIYDMVKVDYNIDGSLTYLEELRKAALDAIHGKEAIYVAMGLHLSVLSLGDGLSMTYPLERYKQFTAFHSGTSVQAVSAMRGYATTSINVLGTHNNVRVDGAKRENAEQQMLIVNAEKNKTIFYDRVPYNQFDRIIMPDIEEPCIQIFYTLQVQYSVITKEQHELNLKRKSEAEEASKTKGNKRKRS